MNYDSLPIEKITLSSMKLLGDPRITHVGKTLGTFLMKIPL